MILSLWGHKSLLRPCCLPSSSADRCTRGKAGLLSNISDELSWPFFWLRTLEEEGPLAPAVSAPHSVLHPDGICRRTELSYSAPVSGAVDTDLARSLCQILPPCRATLATVHDAEGKCERVPIFLDWLDCIEVQIAVRREELSLWEPLYKSSQNNAMISYLGSKQSKVLFVWVGFY